MTGNELIGMLTGSIGVAAVAGVAIVGDYLRQKLPARIAALSISFWNSKWARRIASIAGVGLDHSKRPALGMPLLTEVALGRATDHLFQALPKAMRRELASLRRRSSSSRRMHRICARASLHWMTSSRRPRIRTRTTTSRRSCAPHASSPHSVSAATRAALENIRLDLLRLQTGAVGVASVTASLEAAQRAGQQIDLVLESQSEVERFP